MGPMNDRPTHASHGEPTQPIPVQAPTAQMPPMSPYAPHASQEQGVQPPSAPLGRQRGWLMLVIGSLAIVVAGTTLILVAVVLGRGSSDRDAGVADGAASTSVAVSQAPSSSTPPISQTSVPTTSSTVVTAVATALVEADAAAAVDRYLAASSGRDEGAFAALWSYPIADRYGGEGPGRDAAARSHPGVLGAVPGDEIPSRGATAVTRSSSGWETSTPYAFDGVKTNGDPTCGSTTLRLGFDDQWLVHAASEDPPTPTC